MARQAEDAANGTINRELSYLTRAFCLGAKNGMVAQRLDIEKLEEALPPEAFFELADIRALLAVALIKAQRELTSALEKAQGRITPYVFHRNGEPIKDVRGAWDTAVKKIGLPDRTRMLCVGLPSGSLSGRVSLRRWQ